MQGFNLLKKYINKGDFDQEDKASVLKFINTLYEYGLNSSPVYKHHFELFVREDIFEIVLNLSKTNTSNDLKRQIRALLDKIIPDWNKAGQEHTESGYYYIYKDFPKAIKNIFGYSIDGINFIFKKYSFARRKNYDNQNLYNYIEEFINNDFEKNFHTIVKQLVNQFTMLYSNSNIYTGYELSGGIYSGSNNCYDLDTFQWESILSRCIEQHYNIKNSSEFLKSMVYSKVNKDNPIFIKRSCIPLLLKKLQNASEKNPRENEYYKYLKSILSIKGGIPSTEDVVIHELYSKYSQIPDIYLNQIIEQILYKYSDKGVSGNILVIQFIVYLIEVEKLQFKEDLKRILSDKKLSSHHVYTDILKILESKLHNQNIKEFFNEIKNLKNKLIYRKTKTCYI